MTAQAAIRFAADLAAIWPDGSQIGKPIGLAVSGGPDSVALLLLTHAVVPGRFFVATVDHGLRPEGAAEAAMVAALCSDRGIPHQTISLNLAAGPGVQARARSARYAAMGAWAIEQGLAALVTAHHADDQAETLVMRLNRGAGLRGLGAMRTRSVVPGHDLPLLRPLLGWRRAELAAVCAQAGVTPANDPSNRDARFERARLRTAMAEAEWLDIAALAASAAHLAEADEVLDWATAQALENVVEHAGALVWQSQAPRALQLRVLEAIIVRLGRSTPRGTEIARWHDVLAAGGVATLGGVRGDGRGARWRFDVAPPHRAKG